MIAVGVPLEARRLERDDGPLQLFQAPPENLGEGGVEVVHFALGGEHHDGIRCEVQEGAQAPFGLGDPFHGPLAPGDVLEGLQRPDDAAGSVPQRGRREVDPLAAVSQRRKEVFHLVGPVHGGRPAVFVRIVPVEYRLGHPVHDQVGQHRARLVVKGAPLVVGADDLLGGNPGQALKGLVAGDHPVPGIDDESGDGRALDDLGIPLLPPLYGACRGSPVHGRPIRIGFFRPFDPVFGRLRWTVHPVLPGLPAAALDHPDELELQFGLKLLNSAKNLLEHLLLDLGQFLGVHVVVWFGLFVEDHRHLSDKTELQ